jgi:hypothetical protein
VGNKAGVLEKDLEERKVVFNLPIPLTMMLETGSFGTKTIEMRLSRGFNWGVCGGFSLRRTEMALIERETRLPPSKRKRQAFMGWLEWARVWKFPTGHKCGVLDISSLCLSSV